MGLYRLNFFSGKEPQESKESLIRVKVGDEKTVGVNRWEALLKSTKESSITVQVTPNAEAIVGK